MTSFWTVPGTHEQIDLDALVLDPDWDADYSALDMIAAAATAARDDGCDIE